MPTWKRTEKKHDLHYDEIGKIECPSCGNETPVIVNANMVLYAWCKNKSASGTMCRHRQTFSKEVSATTIEQYLEATKESQSDDGNNDQGDQPGERPGDTPGSDTAGSGGSDTFNTWDNHPGAVPLEDGDTETETQEGEPEEVEDDDEETPGIAAASWRPKLPGFGIV